MRGWLGLLGAGILVLVAGCSGTPTASHKVVTTPRSSGPQVDLNATPPGWVPLDYGDAQISVPPTWVIGTLDCPGLYQGDGWVFLQGITRPSGCPLETRLPLNVIYLRHADLSASCISCSPSQINGFVSLYASAGECHSVGDNCPGAYVVPQLDVALNVQGPNFHSVLQTLTYSPRAVALAPGRSRPFPASWKSVEFGGISASVPSSWPIESFGWPPCPPSNLSLEVEGALLVPGIALSASSCPATSYITVERPTDGLLIDPGPYGPISSSTTFAPCFKVNGLSVCPTTSDLYGVLVASVRVPGRSTPVAVEIGLVGDGMTARTILHSLRAG